MGVGQGWNVQGVRRAGQKGPPRPTLPTINTFLQTCLEIYTRALTYAKMSQGKY